ncbi:MAG: tetratricopeptide repeat protein [Verrucomicrobiota bacterium]
MSDLHSIIQHGSFLRDRRRFDEAVAAFHEGLAQAPDSPELYFELSVTHLQMEGKTNTQKALEHINEAIGYDPEWAPYHAYKGLILNQLNKHGEAKKCANDAIALDGESLLGWTVKGQSFVLKNQWKDAEPCLQKALEIDPDFDMANSLLTITLRGKGDVQSSEEQVAKSLERDADSAPAHANMGWVRLQQGKPREAETHFLEALRLEPEYDYARDGLIEAYKARSLFYRLYLRYCFFLQKFTGAQQVAIMIGAYVGFKFGRALLSSIHPVLGGIFAVAYLIFVFFSWLASGIGHLLILKDPVARMALKLKEKLDGVFVGGAFLLGVILILVGCVTQIMGIIVVGAMFAIAAIPSSLVFLNTKVAGRTLFGALAVVTYCAGTALAIEVFRSGFIFAPEGQSESPIVGISLVVGLFASFGSTWLAMIPGIKAFD